MPDDPNPGDPVHRHDAPWRDRELLQAAINHHGSLSKVADRFDCAVSTISRWRSRHNIDYNNPNQPGNEPYHDRNILLLVLRETESMTATAREFNVARSTIRRWIDRHDITPDEYQNTHHD